MKFLNALAKAKAVCREINNYYWNRAEAEHRAWSDQLNAEMRAWMHQTFGKEAEYNRLKEMYDMMNILGKELKALTATSQREDDETESLAEATQRRSEYIQKMTNLIHDKGIDTRRAEVMTNGLSLTEQTKLLRTKLKELYSASGITVASFDGSGNIDFSKDETYKSFFAPLGVGADFISNEIAVHGNIINKLGNGTEEQIDIATKLIQSEFAKPSNYILDLNDSVFSADTTLDTSIGNFIKPYADGATYTYLDQTRIDTFESSAESVPGLVVGSLRYSTHEKWHRAQILFGIPESVKSEWIRLEEDQIKYSNDINEYDCIQNMNKFFGGTEREYH